MVGWIKSPIILFLWDLEGCRDRLLLYFEGQRIVVILLIEVLIFANLLHLFQLFIDHVQVAVSVLVELTSFVSPSFEMNERAFTNLI